LEDWAKKIRALVLATGKTYREWGRPYDLDGSEVARIVTGRSNKRPAPELWAKIQRALADDNASHHLAAQPAPAAPDLETRIATLEQQVAALMREREEHRPAAPPGRRRASR